jgi:hypothetical protein
LKNGVFKFYLLIVCFVALMCTTITLGMGIYSMVSLVAPKLTLNTYTYTKHQSIESFRRSTPFTGRHNPQAFIAAGSPGVTMPLIRQFEGIHPGVPAGQGVPTDSNKGGDQKTLSDKELNALRLKSFDFALSIHQREALQKLIRLAIIFFISFFLFVVHWRIAHKTDSYAHPDPQ